jgi:heme A synthase
MGGMTIMLAKLLTAQVAPGVANVMLRLPLPIIVTRSEIALLLLTSLVVLNSNVIGISEGKFFL